ncbi:hypothetical protein BABINDRAFT_11094 [Babjeviella inositovora NRRL Y-12698]|uniref:tRNA(His) guanylyltransferase n=1 Tax=Babjeviella inositovora NRRL Y-12698 TaxID=984486 RepID=A0A1E3QYL5_9ASCO|nr:uncharacterized protein BABINDRAFT_11094 [Babjeviella inositovora NRRL Y-12698]ODQ82711.1 hypothetical protein BABINDRAFT_11094 [Babjeviella inositovora NRRL Y-12698]
MANSKYEYVKNFERENHLLPSCYILIRVDGRGFHKFSAHYEFAKPNDAAALQVMNQAAEQMMRQFPDISVCYGDSDEYSFLLRRNCELFERRESKLTSTFASTFSALYQFYWREVIPEKPLTVERLPTFDARCVVYPNAEIVRDYFRWRQVDCHINNLYNTTFWYLVLHGGMTTKEAENRLIGTLASDKHEILFSQFQLNYNNEPEAYKKGTTICREYSVVDAIEGGMMKMELSERQKQREEKKRKKAKVVVHHTDIINDKFWNERPWLLQ